MSAYVPRCSNCGQVGHYAGDCGEPVPWSLLAMFVIGCAVVLAGVIELVTWILEGR